MARAPPGAEHPGPLLALEVATTTLSSSSEVTLEEVACQRAARASVRILVGRCVRGQGAGYAAFENVALVTIVSWTSQAQFSLSCWLRDLLSEFLSLIPERL